MPMTRTRPIRSHNGMPRTLRLTGLVNCLALTLLTAAAGAGGATPPVHGAANDTPPHDAQGGPEYEPVVKQPHLDLTGRKRVGKASFYAKRFAGKKMADGTPMLPHSDNAASKTAAPRHDRESNQPGDRPKRGRHHPRPGDPT